MIPFRAKKCKEDGYTFDSLNERARYMALKLYQRGGLVSDLVVHPKYELKINGVKIGQYTADFRYLDQSGTLVIEDTKSKGTMTPVSSLRIRVFEAIYGLRVTIVGKDVPKVRRFKSKEAA